MDRAENFAELWASPSETFGKNQEVKKAWKREGGDHQPPPYSAAEGGKMTTAQCRQGLTFDRSRSESWSLKNLRIGSPAHAYIPAGSTGGRGGRRTGDTRPARPIRP